MPLSKQKQAPEGKDETRRFKKFIFELSTRLISLPANQIDGEIERRLKLVGEFWSFDQIVLTELSEDAKQIRVIHSYSAPGIRQPSLTISGDRVPWLMEKIRQGETVSLARLPDDLPNDAKADRNFCTRAKIRSAIILPFKIEESVRGGFIFTSLQKERIWTDDLVKELHYLGESLASALEGKEAALRVDELMRFEQLLSEVATTFVNLSSSEVDQAIADGLQRVGTFLQADRCIMYEFLKDKGVFHPSLLWWREEEDEEMQQLNEWAWTRWPFIYESTEYAAEKWRRGEALHFHNLEELPEEAEKLKQLYRRYSLKSSLSIPIFVGGSVCGTLVFSTTQFHRNWPAELIPRLRLMGEIFAKGILRKRADEVRQDAFSTIKQLHKKMTADYMYLREEIKYEHNFDEIVGQSDSLKLVFKKIKEVATTDATVLILGETGTGKELVARAIHNASMRKDRPLIKVDCATLPSDLIENELFGHERGAFTGALNRQVGRFELADGSTLFLDEIGELPLTLQPKLLRAIEDGEFERLGGGRTKKSDVRIIVATNRDLQKEVEEGRFRQDLWYRLNIFPISIPPLRKRTEDIPLLVNWFAKKLGDKMGKQVTFVPQKTLEALKHYSWPGNVRELENVIERAVITSKNKELRIDVPDQLNVSGNNHRSLKDIEREHILQILEDTYWKIEGKNGAAEILSLTPSTLRHRMRKFGIKRPTLSR